MFEAFHLMFGDLQFNHTVDTTTVNDRFLSVRSINGTLFLASALAFISLGQLIVMLTGGIDLSVGPLTGLTVVILSFFASDLNSPPEFILGLALAICAAAVIGLTMVCLYES